MIQWGYLRDYQQELVKQVSKAIAAGGRAPLTVSPTGSGKTVTAMYVMQEMVRNGKTVWFIVHRSELMRQTSRELINHRFGHGIIAPGIKRTGHAMQVGMIETLRNRIKAGKIKDAPDYMIIDECHRACAQQYLDVFAAMPNTVRLGYTATPRRTDGKGLGAVFDSIIEGPTIRELIDIGNLAEYKLFAPPSRLIVDDNRGGLDHQADAAMDRAIVGDAIEHYRRLVDRKRTVVMTPSIAKTIDVAEQYRAAGIRSAEIHSEMSDGERESVIKDLENGALDVVTSCNLLVEGVDIPSIEVVQWLRPTDSLVIWMQGNGRGMRPLPGKTLVILDHVGNYKRQGMPDDERVWSLQGTSGGLKDEEAAVIVSNCSQCYGAYEGRLAVCPYCGHENEAKAKREQEQIDAQLEQVRANEERERKERVRRSQSQSRSLRELVELFAPQGGRNPAARAAHVFCSRQRRKPTARDYAEAQRIYREIKSGGSRGGLF